MSFVAAYVLHSVTVVSPPIITVVKLLECYTISRVDKHPKIWYNKRQGNTERREKE